MRPTLVGVVAASLLMGWAGAAAAQDAPKPEKAGAAEGAKPAEGPKTAPEGTKKPVEAPPPVRKAPPPPDNAPSSPGSLSNWLHWDRATGDWGGQRTKLLEKGIDIQVRYTNDYTRVQHGGADPHQDADRYWLDARATLDLAKLSRNRIPGGGTLHLGYWQFGGENGSKDFGGFNPISSIEADARKEFALLYYENTCVQGRVRTRLGKMDPSEEYGASDYCDDFLNQGISFPVPFFPMPNYPESAVGGDLRFQGEHAYLAGGAFDGSAQEGITTGKFGARHLFGEPADMFYVAEAGYSWKDGARPIRAAFGGWVHTGDFPTASGRINNRASGIYGIVEGMLWKQNRDDARDERGLYLVLRMASIESSVSPVEDQSGVAAVWRGPLASRGKDSLGVAWTRANVTRDDGGFFPEASEQVVEAYYRIQATPFLAITPDVQYVGGTAGGLLPDGLIFGLRVVVDF